MVSEAASPAVVYVGPATAGRVVPRLESVSVSVTTVPDLSTLAARLDSGVDCVVTRHDLPDGTGFDAQTLVERSAVSVPVVLLAEPTGDVAATAVEQDLGGFVPLKDGRPADRFEATVGRAVRSDAADTAVATDDVEWKADILDQLVTRVPIHVYVKDEQAEHVLVSRAHVDDPSSVLGQSDLDSDLVPPEEAEAGYEDDLQVLETGDPIIDREEYYPSRDEWYLTSKVPRYDEDGNIVGLIGVSREITERRKAQERLETLNERLEQFVSVVSHDLRNPLTVAMGRVEHERDRRDSEHLAATDRALTRMESLIEDLLTLASSDDIDRTDRIRLSSVARSCWDDVPTDGATLTVDSDLVFEGARGRVRQLFENLFRNSVEHGATDDRAASESADTVAVTVGALSSGDGFFVADDGPGIPTAKHGTVFELGYTTHESGTGFGLSIVADIVQAHGWSVEVKSAESGGARFEVSGVEVLD